MAEPVQTPPAVAVANQKGGVGKTTTTLNLGGALNERGQDVLLVDADPQGYLTSSVGLDDAYTSDDASLYDALLEPEEHRLVDLARPHPAGEFDVVPAHVDLFALQQELVTAMRGRERLEMLFDEIPGDPYDIILVDAPPSLGIMNDNVLLATKNIVVPALAEDSSIRAFDILFNQVETLEDRYETEIREIAVVVSRVEYPLDGEQRAMLDWFSETFGDAVPVVEVRKRTAIKRAWNAEQSIFAHDEECDQRDSLLDLADAVLDRVGGQEVSA